MASLRAKIALQFVVNNLTIVSNFALAVLLARLLTPTDIGIFSMSAVLIAIAHVFRDFGVAAYIKREKELTEQTLRSAMGLLVTTSWTASAILFVSASYWADFLHEPRIADVVRVLALGFIFIPFGAIPSAILTRRMEVRKTSKVAIVSNLSHFAVCLGLAQAGLGHMTMAWANLVDILICGIGYRWVLGERLPVWPSVIGWKRIAHFGLGNILPSLLQKIDAAIPDLVLGRLSTPAAVGLFSRANSTVNMLGEAINPTINYFALPYLAQVHHKNGRIDQEYLKASSLVNSIVFPALVTVAILSPELVGFLFGQQWLPSAHAIPWLCVAYGVSSLFTFTTSAMNSIGKPYGAIWPLMALVTLKVGLAFTLFDGTLQNFAFCVALAQLSSVPLYLFINKLFLKVSLLDWLGDTWRLLILAVITGVACYGAKQAIPTGTSIILVLLTGGCVTVTVSFFSYWLIGLPIIHELAGVPVFRRLLSGLSRK
ncbi:oligosaccharide flippase family protein [Rhodoferax sp. 4810]|nr:oligosaccharide flippase family protein [Rhodoferax jenense]